MAGNIVEKLDYERRDNVVSNLALALPKIRGLDDGGFVCVAATANDVWAEETLEMKLDELRLNDIDVGENPLCLYGSVVCCSENWRKLYVFKRGK